MLRRVPRAPAAARALALLAALATTAMLAACGSSEKTAAQARLSASTKTPTACAEAVLETLRGVARRIYHEGVLSERTASARYLITHSRALSRAVESGDAAGARAAEQALIATGHVTNLTVERGNSVLASAGSGDALAPLQGTILGSSGAVVGKYTASVWGSTGLINETTGVTEAETVIRRETRTLDGKFTLPSGPLRARGTFAIAGKDYVYTSLPASEYPSGAHLRVYLVRGVSSTRALCGATVEDTTVNTLAHVARALYEGEAGSRAQVEVRRVQRNQPLLRAVAARDRAATTRAIDALLTEHIVRLRVIAGPMLVDVGGPYVLAPVSAPLRLHGRTIGHLILSIQDDEGYLRLARRLAGLDVLMYMGGRVVKNSLGPVPAVIPEEGRISYHGRTFRTITGHAKAFPSGPLRIIVFIPIPYS